MPMPFMLSSSKPQTTETPQPQVQAPPQQRRQNNDSKIPKHTVFLFSISYSQPENEVRDYVSSFGDINNFYSQIPEKGNAFVTFFDIRDAQRLVEDAKNKTLGDRAVHANYAFKNHTPKHDRWETCANVQLKGMMPTKLTELDIQQAMSQYGEIRCTETVPPNPYGICFKVKYFDIRHAHNAMRNSYITIKDEHFRLEFFPDEEEESSDNSTNPSFGGPSTIIPSMYYSNQVGNMPNLNNLQPKLGNMSNPFPMQNLSHNKIAPIVSSNSNFPPAQYGNMANNSMPNPSQLNMFNLSSQNSNSIPSSANLDFVQKILKQINNNK